MRNTDILGTAAEAVLFFVPFLFALCFHEFAHGWVARLKGDRTAEIMGRLTLNPLAHIDPIGTVVVPLVAFVSHIPLFGWAKPVPYDPRNLRNPKNDAFWVAAAGPLSNLLLAVVGALGLAAFFVAMPESMDLRPAQEAALRARSPAAYAALVMLIKFLQINLVLAIFNLIPVHPLDGGKVLGRFLPYRVNRWLEEREQMIGLLMLPLFIFGGLAFLNAPINFGVDALYGLARRLALLFVQA